MKKILVVLLVLAVAGGVFAQEGEWSLNGTAQIGVAVDFDPLPGATGDSPMATSGWSQYNRLYDGSNYLEGELGINYNRDSIDAGVQIRSVLPQASNFIGHLSYGGENFNFKAESDLAALTSQGWTEMKALWGNYSFLDGLFFLEASYVSGWKGEWLWYSDTTGAFRSWEGRSNEVINGPFPGGSTFTKTGGDWINGPSSYIVGDVRLQGLSFGLMIRDIFLREKEYSIKNVNSNTLAAPLSITLPMTFVDDVLKEMIFGVKFEFNPIEVAAQFLMKDYGVYLGGKWFVGPVTVGLSYMGILGEKELDLLTVNSLDYTKAKKTDEDKFMDALYDSLGLPITDAEGNPIFKSGEASLAGDYVVKKTYKATNNTNMKVGASVNYDADGFGASIKGFLAIRGDKAKKFSWDEDGKLADGYISQIGVEPGFYYNVIPTHLQFKLDAGFYFFTFYQNGGTTKVDTFDGKGLNGLQFALQPQLFWNFLGTGAGGYGGTGIALRYRLVGGDTTKYAQLGFNNKFDVNFRWSF